MESQGISYEEENVVGFPVKIVAHHYNNKLILKVTENDGTICVTDNDNEIYSVALDTPEEKIVSFFFIKYDFRFSKPILLLFSVPLLQKSAR